MLAYPPSFNFPDGAIPLHFRPTAHIFYSERVVDIHDGVSKWSQHKNRSEPMSELSTESRGKRYRYVVLLRCLTRVFASRNYSLFDPQKLVQVDEVDGLWDV